VRGYNHLGPLKKWKSEDYPMLCIDQMPEVEVRDVAAHDRNQFKGGNAMKRLTCLLLLSGALVLSIILMASVWAEKQYDTSPPFKLEGLTRTEMKIEETGKEGTFYEPKNPYNIFINYELGMHCVGFDVSYCCVIPPYNSIQAQAVKAGTQGDSPHLLSPDDKVKLAYWVRDNSYSEGNKMKYWQVAKDVDGNGKMSDPGDNMPNYVWDHLFIYKDLEGTLPENPEQSARLYIGKEIPINIDSGPSGKPLSGGYLDYAKKGGGDIVFTDTMMPQLKNIPLKLTASYLWDALGLPMTAFYDSRRKGTIRTIAETDFQPFQYAMVQLQDVKGEPLTTKGKNVEFFGTEPIDIPNCLYCHSGQGVAANMSRQSGLSAFDKEYAYWKNNYPDVSEYICRLTSASINLLELHDKNFKTAFLADYNPDEASNRLGAVGPVYCADCHGDNISGNLQTPRPGTTGYSPAKGKPLTEAIHSVHAGFIPMPDKAGRTQNCQACHPMHWQEEAMNVPGKNPYAIIDELGNPRFSDTDIRTGGGGCFLRRDAHANPDVKPPFFLNAIGKWYLNEVSMTDVQGMPTKSLRGLYCTNCHNQLTHELYRYDDLDNVISQSGKTLRNKPIAEVIAAVAEGDSKKFKSYFADPLVGVEGDPLFSFYGNHQGSILLRVTKDEKGNPVPHAWNAEQGDALLYDNAAGGKDWWLAPGLPHCANCHQAPFVESAGGTYFPIDQPNKYALYRFSKAHHDIACQSCHESMHGLYPVRYGGPNETVDKTSHEQAIQFSPDNEYAGPVTCVACHSVNKKGVPAELAQTEYQDDYWASVVLMHFMRAGDQEMTVPELLAKYPYATAHEIVMKGFE
jgi:mono/diheme cytochrome c family protein